MGAEKVAIYPDYRYIGDKDAYMVMTGMLYTFYRMLCIVLLCSVYHYVNYTVTG